MLQPTEDWKLFLSDDSALRVSIHASSNHAKRCKIWICDYKEE